MNDHEDRPKSDPAPVTRREILMCRRAAELAARRTFQHFELPAACRGLWKGSREVAADLYPLPKKKVMREVTTPNGFRYRLNGGTLEFLSELQGWCRSRNVHISSYKAISDLYANPTVEVDDDGTD